MRYIVEKDCTGSGNPVKVIKPQKSDAHIEFYDDGSGDIESESRKKNDESKPAEKDTNIFTNTIENITDVIDELKEVHYARNDNQPIEDLPQTINEAKEMNWNIDVADCHQFSAEPGEVHIKYVSPDGKKEAIYHDENHGGTLVTDPRDIGTYNYAPHVEKGISDEIGHFVYDVLPWFLWGNSADDTTTMTERVTAFCFGWINRI